MRSNRKHTVEELEVYIKAYLSGVSYPQLYKEGVLLLSESTFNQYVLKYQEHGRVALESKKRNNTYSQTFKESNIAEYFEVGTPIKVLVSNYNILNHSTVHNWIIKYTKGEALKAYHPKPGLHAMKSKKFT
ncbi:hypothetical protein [Facklamia miroungae]|uniref:Transposase n=1 Tax=Facklamia miroungae TaxID=120956 RepID=A0A1G7S150_9LACT|nr:hypothetical protein [Facklamia miroungae]NKZ29203.1 hypothetical protein [Facklamia miroungae]SDG16748.1 hypothetical protein SAMN05421791_103255 [Facklamia miroungae]